MGQKTYSQLKAELDELDAKMEEAWQQERREALDTVHRLIDRYNIKRMELKRGRRGSYRTKPVEPIYRDPVSGREWSGRGNPPQWIRNKDRRQFLIK